MENSTQKPVDERCRVHLEMFEGPLDLLLYLIKRDEIDIYDIPISHVVKEYVSYIDKMEALDLSLAGEYLLMAALLMSIKARMLLPSANPDVEEIEDPRQELVDMIVEYQLYKKIGERLSRFREEHENHYPKGAFPDSAEPGNSILEEIAPVDLYSLFKIAWEILKREKLIVPGYEGDEVDVEERMSFIKNFIKGRKKARFIELFDGPVTAMLFVATFIGLLELVRERHLRIEQSDSFSEIWLYYGKGEIELE